MLAQQKLYRAANVEKFKKYNKEYKKKHKKKHKKKNALWYRKNKKYVHEYYLKNYKRHLIQNAAWRKLHPEVSKASQARRRTRKSKAGGTFTAKQFMTLCTLYEYKCLCCHKKKPLEADHIISIAKGRTSNISNIQPLCRSCNSRKGTKTIDYRTQPESDAMSIGRK